MRQKKDITDPSLQVDINEATIAVRENRFIDALKILQINLSKYPDHIDSLYLAAVSSRYLKKYDESKHAQLIAKHFKTNHMELNADDIGPEIFYKLVKYYDEPMVDSSMIPTFLVSELVKNYCKVVLGGDGGDELFGGYEHYSRLLWMEKYLGGVPLSISSAISFT